MVIDHQSLNQRSWQIYLKVFSRLNTRLSFKGVDISTHVLLQTCFVGKNNVAFLSSMTSLTNVDPVPKGGVGDFHKTGSVFWTNF